MTTGLNFIDAVFCSQNSRNLFDSRSSAARTTASTDEAFLSSHNAQCRRRATSKSDQEKLKRMNQVLCHTLVENDLSDVTSKPSSSFCSDVTSATMTEEYSSEDSNVFVEISSSTSTKSFQDDNETVTTRGIKKALRDKYRVDDLDDCDKYISIGDVDKSRSLDHTASLTKSLQEESREDVQKSRPKPIRFSDGRNFLNSSKRQKETGKQLQASSKERRQIHKYKTSCGLHKGHVHEITLRHTVGEAFKKSVVNLNYILHSFTKREKQKAHNAKSSFRKQGQVKKYDALTTPHRVNVREYNPATKSKINEIAVSTIDRGKDKFPEDDSARSVGVDQSKEMSNTKSIRESAGKVKTKNKRLKIIAPFYLAPGSEVKVNVDGKEVKTVVPPQGIEKGKVFFIAYKQGKASKNLELKSHQSLHNSMKKTKTTNMPPSILKNKLSKVPKREDSVTIQAPSYLPPGCEVKVTIDGSEIKATVPPQGISKGEIFLMKGS